MCGIFLLITADFNFDTNFLNKSNIRKFLNNRGPDYFQSIDFKVDCFDFHLESSVLKLRGENDSGKQPYRSLLDSASLLQWNGQIFRLVDLDSNDEKYINISESHSDTEYLMNLLDLCHDKSDIVKVISSIHGPWSMTYWNNKLKQLWIGRDILGRRSLCWNINFRDKFLIVTSVANIFNLKENNLLLKETNFDWSLVNFEEIPTDCVFCLNFKFKTFSDIWNNCEQFYWPKNIDGSDAKVTVDNKFLLHSTIQTNLNLTPPNNEIDQLLKVDFKIPEDVYNNFIQVLSESVRIRCHNHRNRCRNCINTDKICDHAIVAILFSGGIDSTILAIFSHNAIPINRPIDLINVAFTSDAPDRKTGLDAWNELCFLFPKRQWNFIEVNIDSTELSHYRSERIGHLIYPKLTIMDDSIGCSLWFASRGQGVLNTNGENYKTTSRIVLIGIGADELLGGYSRHRVAFGKNGNWLALINEIITDINRLPSRNLGRDDRVIADHGIEARFPYLDELVINFLLPLPIWYKTNLYLNRGFGEKWLLRLVAQKLGLKNNSNNIKRAIQFGSKIVSHQSSKVTGTDLTKY